MSIVRQGTLPVGSLDHAITLNVQSSGGSHFETVTDTTPYLHRASPQDVASSMNLKKVVGGTIAWNQMVQNGNFESTSGWSRVNGSLSANNNELTYTLTAVGQYGYENQIAHTLAENMVSGHKYLLSFDCYGSKAMTLTLWLNVVGNNTWYQVPYSTSNAWGSIATVVSASSVKNQIAIAFNAVMNSLAVGDAIKVRNVMVIDLTQMFGSTIADYIYSLEQAHAGDGVAWFKALFGEDYYPYNSGELLSVKTSARKTYNADNVEIGSYPLDGDLELRGIPKLDGNNELYYDGDTYASDGNVTRKWGYIEVDGSEDENWILHNSGRERYAFRYNLPYTTTAYTNVRTNRIEVNSTNEDYENGGRVSCRATQYASTYFYIFTPPSVASTLTEFKAWLSANPVQLIYALTQSEYTESADAYTQSQRVGATEEFVDARSVEIPVGNVSEYKRLIQGGTA